MIRSPEATRTRVSSTCTIWSAAEELRIQAHPLPSWATGSFFLCASAAAASSFYDRSIVYGYVIGCLALGSLFITLFTFNFSVMSGEFRTWNLFAGIRFAEQVIDMRDVTAVAASSVYVAAYGRTYYHLESRVSHGFFRRHIDLWNREDALAAATALVKWMNQHRAPHLDPIQFVDLKWDRARARKPEL